MRVGDLVRHEDGRYGIIEWLNDHIQLYDMRSVVVITIPAGSVWWNVHQVEVISELSMN